MTTPPRSGATPVGKTLLIQVDPSAPNERLLRVDGAFSLAATCGPVAWARGRWPTVDWIDGALIWTGWEEGEIVSRVVRELLTDGVTLTIHGTARPEGDAAWANAVLGLSAIAPIGTDHVVEAARQRFSGLRAWTNGSLFDGLVSSIVGQSISVAAAAVTETRLSALFHEGLAIGERRFWPLPTAEMLASADPATIRQSGVTWRRAEALVAAGQASLAGRIPSDDEARHDPIAARTALRALPLVGPWTAESALLWGIGEADAYPAGDAALLRAARFAYQRSDLDHAGLNALAAGWSPSRGWAARLLWAELFGPAE